MLHFDFTFNPKFLRQVTLDQSPDSSINTGRLNFSRWGGHRLGLSLSWLSNAIRFKLLFTPSMSWRIITTSNNLSASKVFEWCYA